MHSYHSTKEMGAREMSTVCLSGGGGGRGWLMNVIERYIMEPSVVAGFRTAAAAAVDGLHGVLRWSRGAAGTER